MNSPEEHPVTPVIPDHQLLRQIGEGGYGQVWLARNIIGTYRAVKIVFRSKFCEAAPYDREFKGIKKFEPISRTHPGLVDILQIGRNDPDGYFYYVMELADDEVAGGELHPDFYSAKTLGKELDARGRLPVGEALRLGIHLAEALGHMHKNGLIHRDIKPSNIIFVGGAPKLADIGLVVAVSDARTFVGTEGFIPPEGPGTAQADLYSLGKVLYEIGTGQDRQSYPELPPDLGAFPDCDQLMELNEVIVKACANATQDRYKLAEELRSDLEMLLAGRSVKRLRFVERQLSRVRRVAVVATIIALAAVAFGYAVMRIRQREQGLLAAAYVTSGNRLMEDGNLHGSLPYFAEALRLEGKDAAAESHRLRIGSALQQSPKLLQFWQLTNCVKDLHFSPDGTQLLLAGRKMVRLVDLQSGTFVGEMSVSADIETAVFSPDGRQIVIAEGDFLILTDAGLGAILWRMKLPRAILSAEFSPDGETIIAAGADGCVHFLEAQTGQPLDVRVKGHSGELCYASFSPDGTLFLTASRDGTARLWDVRTRSLLHSNLIYDHWIHDASFSPDSRKYVTASTDHTVRIWDVATGRESAGRMEHRGEVRRARFSPDGGTIVSIGYDNAVRLWNTHTGRPLAATLNLQGIGMAAVFSPEGRRVATADHSGAVKIWDIAPTAPLRVGPAIISPDGQRYITYGSNSFRVWRARDDTPLTAWIPSAGTIETVLTSTNAATVVLIGKTDPNNLSLVETHSTDGGPSHVFSLSKATRRWLSPDGRWLLASGRNDASLWETATGRRVFEQSGFATPVRPAAFSPDGQSVLVVSGKNIFSYDLKSGAETFPHWQHTMNPKTIDFSPDGSKFVIALDGTEFSPGSAEIVDAKTGRLLGAALPHGEGVGKALFSHDGLSVATAAKGRGAGIWDVRTEQLRFTPFSLLWQVREVDWSPNDRWLLAGSWFEGQVLDASNGRPVTPAFVSTDAFLSGGFFADGRRIWARTARTVLMWDLPPASGTPDEIIALAHHLGVIIPAETRLEDTPAAGAQRRLRGLTSRQQFGASLEEWHQQMADAAARQPDWFAAQFHLDQLLKESPDDEALLARRDMAAQEWAKSSAPPLSPGGPVPLERIP